MCGNVDRVARYHHTLTSLLLPSVRIRSQRFISGVVLWREVQEVPVLCCCRLARWHLRISKHGWLTAWWHHCVVLGYLDALWWERLCWSYQTDHQNCSLPQVRVCVENGVLLCLLLFLLVGLRHLYLVAHPLTTYCLLIDGGLDQPLTNGAQGGDTCIAFCGMTWEWGRLGEAGGSGQRLGLLGFWSP